jgi:restriction system protein
LRAMIGSVPATAHQQATLTQGTASVIPACPKCGSPMVERTAKSGSNAGKSFWGCSRFPACRGIRS